MYLSATLVLISMAAFSLNAAPAPVDHKVSTQSNSMDLDTRSYNVGMLIGYRACCGAIFLTYSTERDVPLNRAVDDGEEPNEGKSAMQYWLVRCLLID